MRTVRPAKYSNAQRMRNESDHYSFRPFDEHHCIFVHIPKTAGISVSTALFGCLAGGHASVSHYQMVFDRKTFNRFFKFTFVRNPWDRLYSAYRFLSNGGMTEQDARWAAEHISQFVTFDTFVAQWLTEENLRSYPHFIPQVEFLRLPGRSSLLVDFIGRFESLDVDFRTVCDRIGIPATLGHHNNSGHVRERNYREAYSSAARRRVADLYKDDIEVFGYGF